MAARHRVTWSRQARHGLDEILGYIARDSPSAAERMLDEVIGAAESLSALGERGRIVPELDEPTVRELLVGRYRLIYEVGAAEIVVLAVVHGARSLSLRWRAR